MTHLIVLIQQSESVTTRVLIAFSAFQLELWPSGDPQDLLRSAEHHVTSDPRGSGEETNFQLNHMIFLRPCVRDP